MNWPHTPRWILLGVWLAVLVAGYMASRANVFAAGGQNDCIPCKYCEFMSTTWDSGGNNYAGTVWTADGHTPAEVAVYGTALGGVQDDYSDTACDGNSGKPECENWVTIVHYSSATLECKPAAPAPKGTYKCTNGQNLQLQKNSFCPDFCSTT